MNILQQVYGQNVQQLRYVWTRVDTNSSLVHHTAPYCEYAAGTFQFYKGFVGESYFVPARYIDENVKFWSSQQQPDGTPSGDPSTWHLKTGRTARLELIGGDGTVGVTIPSIPRELIYHFTVEEGSFPNYGNVRTIIMRSVMLTAAYTIVIPVPELK